MSFKDLFIDRRTKNRKCGTCLFVHGAYDTVIPFPCDRCIHRPTRYKDKSEYIPMDTQNTTIRTEKEQVDY